MKTTTVTTIAYLLAAGRVVEARALLIPKESSLSSDELRKYSSEIARRLAQAEALVVQAAVMERAGKIDEAKALYESVPPIVADFPGITENLNRIDEVSQLTRAVQRRSERLRRSRSAGTGKADPKKNRIIWPALGASVAAAALLLAVTMSWAPRPETEKKRIEATPSPAVAPPTDSAPSTPPAQDRPSIPVHIQPPATAAQQPEPHQPPTAPDKEPLHDAPLLPYQELPSSESEAPYHPHDPLPPRQEPSSSASNAPHLSRAPAPASPAPVAPPIPVAPQVPVAAPTNNQPTNLFYTVRQADSLSSIARNELCNAMAWQQIYQLNRDRITDPDQILPGMILRLTGLENRCHPVR